MGTVALGPRALRSKSRHRRRGRWEPYREWRTVQEESVDIPELDYFDLRFSERSRLLVYRIPRDGGQFDYFLQNPAYLEATDMQGVFSEDRASMIAIDANANGVFFEPEDRVFFNNVNPYRQNSAHAELRGFLGNYWYRVSELEEHHLIEVGLRGGKLRFTSPNARYAGIAERGSLIVQNLPAGASVSLNGRTYWPKVSGVFEAPIEFGVYQLRIGAPGAADQVEQLTVDEAHRAIAVAYRPAPAGALSLQNLSLDHWKWWSGAATALSAYTRTPASCISRQGATTLASRQAAPGSAGW